MIAMTLKGRLFDLALAPKFAQFRRYVIVGLASFVLEYGLFALCLKGLGWSYLAANTLVYPVVCLVNFALNRQWTFAASGNVLAQALRYLALLAFNLVAGNAVLYLLCDGLGVDALIAKIAVMALIVLWNFGIYKWLVYR